MIVVRESDLTYMETPGANATAGIAVPSRGATDLSVIRQRQQPGGSNPAHYHDREEVLLVLSGAVTVTADESSVTVQAGDTLIIPAGTAHQLANAGESEADWLLLGPSGIGFFRPDGERADPAWAQ